MTGSRKRHTKPPFRGQPGRCSWCGTTELPKGRQSWCSQRCVDEYLSRSSSAHIRRRVYERDRGICALCGCDANVEYTRWRDRRREVAHLADRLVAQSRWDLVWDGREMVFRDTKYPDAPAVRRFRARLFAKYAPGRWTSGRSTGWDADHIVPVVEGGGQCGLDNYRTLCHPCHKDETAKLAGRRANQGGKGRRKNDPPKTPQI